MRAVIISFENRYPLNGIQFTDWGFSSKHRNEPSFSAHYDLKLNYKTNLIVRIECIEFSLLHLEAMVDITERIQRLQQRHTGIPSSQRVVGSQKCRIFLNGLSPCFRQVAALLLP